MVIVFQNCELDDYEVIPRTANLRSRLKIIIHACYKSMYRLTCQWCYIHLHLKIKMKMHVTSLTRRTVLFFRKIEPLTKGSYVSGFKTKRNVHSYIPVVGTDAQSVLVFSFVCRTCSRHPITNPVRWVCLFMHW